MTGGSQQARILRRALRDGASLANAAEAAGMSLDEAGFQQRDEERSPPPAEAFELLPIRSTTEEEEAAVAKEKNETDGAPADGGVYNAPNAREAIKIYRNEIAPRKAFIQEKSGDLSDPYKRIKDECNFPRKIIDLLFFLEGCEDAKRDHFLTALHQGLTEMNFKRPTDLLTLAEGQAGGDVVPGGGKAEKPRMATLQPHTAGDDDLARAGGAEPTSLQLN